MECPPYRDAELARLSSHMRISNFTLSSFSGPVILVTQWSFSGPPRSALIRSFCSGSASQLVSDIERICSELQKENRLSIPECKITALKEKISDNSYSFFPLRVELIEQRDLPYYLEKNLGNSPDEITINCSSGSTVVRIVRPYNHEDGLLLLALSITILRVLKGGLPRNGYRLDDGVEAFYDTIRLIGKAEKLIKIELLISPKFTPPICAIERMLSQHLTKDSPVFRLISSFLSLPIIDNYGFDLRDSSDFKGIPEVGEIKTVLWEVIFMQIVDLHFAKPLVPCRSSAWVWVRGSITAVLRRLTGSQ